MKGQVSYSALGNKLIHELRDKLNNTENIADIRHVFSYTVIKLLNKAFEENDIVIDAEDVRFKPNNNTHYHISKRLMNINSFQETWQNSDLKNVINKYANSAYKRYLHTNKHLEKTNKKIRQA